MDEILDNTLIGDYNGTVHGSPQMLPGVVGSALRIDAMTQYILYGDVTHGTCAQDLDLCASTGFSLAFWFRPLDNMGAVLTNGGGLATGKGFYIFYSDDGELFVFLNGDSTALVTVSGVPYGGWSHYVIVWSDSGGLDVYRDGCAYGHADNEPRPAPFDPTSLNYVELAVSASALFIRGFNPLRFDIDDVEIRYETLSGVQIWYMYTVAALG